MTETDPRGHEWGKGAMVLGQFMMTPNASSLYR